MLCIYIEGSEEREATPASSDHENIEGSEERVATSEHTEGSEEQDTAPIATTKHFQLLLGSGNTGAAKQSAADCINYISGLIVLGVFSLVLVVISSILTTIIIILLRMQKRSQRMGCKP